MILFFCSLQVIHYEMPNDPETFVHRSGRTGRAGKEGNAILMFSNSQRRTVRSLERDVGCHFEFISPPSVEDVLESSAEQVVATLNGVHPESIQFFIPTAEKMIEEKGVSSLAAALAHLSGFSQPPSSRSLISHEQVSKEHLISTSEIFLVSLFSDVTYIFPGMLIVVACTFFSLLFENCNEMRLAYLVFNI